MLYKNTKYFFRKLLPAFYENTVCLATEKEFIMLLTAHFSEQKVCIFCYFYISVKLYWQNLCKFHYQ